MIDYVYLLTIFLGAFIFTMLISQPILAFLKKIKAKQSIHEDVTMHKSKEGTPTMGGLMFIIPLIFSLLFVSNNNFLSILTVAITLGYGIVGFLDDYIKIALKRNMGLRAYQKIIGQGGLAIITALVCYYTPMVNNTLILPFGLESLELTYFVIPLVIILFLSATNAVNLTDGLDGLAGGVSFVYLLTFGGLIAIVTTFLTNNGASLQIVNEQQNLLVLITVFSSSILAFLVYNSNKAKVFMGDVGSLSIGAFISCIAAFTNLYLFVIIVGIMFVISTISVVIQVLYYKKTKRRIFLMAPLHHHFEKKGVNESKIVSIYVIITILAGVFALLSAII